MLLALGAVGWDAALRRARRRRGRGRASGTAPRRRWAGRILLGSYHPSPQNVSTGRLTPAMLDDVLARARELAQSPG